MNKETFLEELRGYLQILEDQEQQDILDEYSQHIDMKIQKGLSEEEAIRDFGSMKELAAEILEAYHVKPGFEGPQAQRKKLDLSKIKVPDGGKAIRKTGGFFKESFAALGRGIRKTGRWIAGTCRAFAAWITKPFRKKREDGNSGLERETDVIREAVQEDNRQQNEIRTPETGRRKKTPGSEFFCAAGRGIAAVWRALLALCRWCLRLLWNLFWLLCSACTGLFALLALFGFGALVILLFQGYPLVGVELICLGAILCFGTLCCGCFSLLIRKKQGKAEEAEEAEMGEDPKEVQYE